MAGIVKPTYQVDTTFICPITGGENIRDSLNGLNADVMVDPVHLKGECAQHIFERNNILTYINYRKDTQDLQCPSCNRKFSKVDIETDTGLAKQIQEWRKKYGLTAPSPPEIAKPDPKDAKKEKLANEQEDENIARQVEQQINPHTQPYQHQDFSPPPSHHHSNPLSGVLSKAEADLALALQLDQQEQHSPPKKEDPLCEFLKEIYYECISPIIGFFLWLLRIEIKKNG